MFSVFLVFTRIGPLQNCKFCFKFTKILYSLFWAQKSKISQQCSVFNVHLFLQNIFLSKELLGKNLSQLGQRLNCYNKENPQIQWLAYNRILFFRRQSNHQVTSASWNLPPSCSCSGTALTFVISTMPCPKSAFQPRGKRAAVQGQQLDF